MWVFFVDVIAIQLQTWCMKSVVEVGEKIVPVGVLLFSVILLYNRDISYISFVLMVFASVCMLAPIDSEDKHIALKEIVHIFLPVVCIYLALYKFS
jgi:hypothetical protein